MRKASNEPVEPSRALPQIEIAPIPAVGRPTRWPAPPPRPGIGHLMLWVACCALFMGLVRPGVQAPPGAVGLAVLAAVGLSASLGWAGLAIVATRCLRTRWPIQPGEWLLAALGVRLGLEALAVLLEAHRFVHSPQLVVESLVCCFLVLPLFGKLPRTWIIVFIVMILITAVPLVTAVLALVGWFDLPPAFVQTGMAGTQSPVTLLVVLLAMGIDHRQGNQYGWLHWLGLATLSWHHLLRAALFHL
jgi:hypothetical protein